MSIRLRLTLLYSLILALTLVIFSSALYLIQARMVLNNTKRELIQRSEADLERPMMRERWRQLPHMSPDRIGALSQIRTLEGEVLGRTPTLGDSTTLPLSRAGLRAIRRGQTWIETDTIESERMLIYSRPFRGPGNTTLIFQTAIPLSGQERSLVLLRRLLIIGSSVAVVAAFGIGWLLAGLALRPINRLRQTAQAIGAERNFSRRVDYTGPPDEIGQLARTFNDMLSQLQAAYLHVEQTLQMQRRFVADASHELRTPLTTLRGNLSLLQRKPPVSETDRTDILADMVDETERLMRLVGQLLALARSDAGRSLPLETVRLSPLLEEVCQQIRTLAAQHTITCRIEPDITLWGNEDALKQTVLALLDNAVKYTPPGSQVTLTAHQEQAQAKIQVQDDGPGIAAEHLPHIFERFYRGDTARTGGGAGLGLAIAQELTQAQHGSITVHSRPGEGTTFTLIFPTE